MKKLLDFADIKDIPDGYIYTSPQKRAWYLWTLFFGFITGDLNPIHVNFLTSTSYKSTLGGLARHGISTIAEAESFIFNIFKFEVPTEIIALGYSNITYKKPVNIGNKITYTYTLLSKNIKEKRNYAQCIWHISGNNDKGVEIFTAEWTVRYSTIEMNIVKDHAYPMGWLFPPVEVSGTPLSLLGWRLVRFICIGIIVYLFAHAWLD
ncbi:MAG: MaoC/PaaZ C-terminal domain-containing protein [Patescibacteria group bacterium]